VRKQTEKETAKRAALYFTLNVEVVIQQLDAVYAAHQLPIVMLLVLMVVLTYPALKRFKLATLPLPHVILTKKITLACAIISARVAITELVQSAGQMYPRDGLIVGSELQKITFHADRQSLIKLLVLEC
jgi:hypothetical protein